MLAIYSHHIQRGLGELDFEPLNGEDIKRRRKNRPSTGYRIWWPNTTAS